MEEVFVPHWQKLWANWKGRHWSIMSIPGMHASDWKDEGPSVNPLGKDGASSVNPLGEDGASSVDSLGEEGPSVNPLGEDGMHVSDWKDEASIVHEFVTQTLASRRS